MREAAAKLPIKHKPSKPSPGIKAFRHVESMKWNGQSVYELEIVIKQLIVL